ncbi:MAG: 3'-5' exonuclease [Gillisia sp.]
MGFDWFRKTKKDYPQFWKDYVSCFKKNPEKSAQNRYVIFDCETTGLDPKKDMILSIGAIGIEGDTIRVNDCFEFFLEQEVYRPETVSIHGILKAGKEQKLTESETIVRFLSYIKDAILVGHHTNFDVEMINQALKRFGLGKLKNKKIDTNTLYQKYKGWQSDQYSGLDELCAAFKISKSDRHTASGDAFITALIFLKLKKKLKL